MLIAAPPIRPLAMSGATAAGRKAAAFGEKASTLRFIDTLRVLVLRDWGLLAGKRDKGAGAERAAGKGSKGASGTAFAGGGLDFKVHDNCVIGFNSGQWSDDGDCVPTMV